MRRYLDPKNIPSKHRENLRRYDWKPRDWGNQSKMLSPSLKLVLDILPRRNFCRKSNRAFRRLQPFVLATFESDAVNSWFRLEKRDLTRMPFFHRKWWMHRKPGICFLGMGGVFFLLGLLGVDQFWRGWHDIHMQVSMHENIFSGGKYYGRSFGGVHFFLKFEDSFLC